MTFQLRLVPLAAVLALGGAAHAQIDLPQNKVKPPAPSKPAEVPDSKDSLLERELGQGGASAPRAKSDLELPRERSAAGVPAAAATAPAPAPSAAPEAAPAAPLLQGGSTAADFVLSELAKTREVSSPLVEQASQSLLRMGEAGRAAAFKALDSEHAPTLLAGARTLLRSGHPADADRVCDRLRLKLPNLACAALVDALCALDPVRASPRFLGELLTHRQTAVRTAANRQLARLGPAVPLDALALPLASKDSDARLRAVQLAAASNERGALDVLLGHLDDPSGVVARRVVDELALRESAELDQELLRRAFGERWVLRGGAYALLALCEREEQLLTPVLGSAHVPRLLEGLKSSDSFIAGSCAAALAGVGFRSTDTLDTGWLDLEVPHRLVRAVSAEEFSPDFSSLVPTAVRRLHLLTGENFGTDGPRWMSWWAGRAEGFHAARAALPVGPEQAGALELRVASDLPDGQEFRLVGLARAAELASAGTLVGETFVLSEAQARALYEALRTSGALGAERLPGLRGSAFEPGRTLTLSHSGRSKSFRFAGSGGDSWFVQVLETAQSLRSRNRWQLHADPKLPLTRLEFFEVESPWWDEVTDEAQRSRRLWTLATTRLRHLPEDQRDSGVRQLALISREPGAMNAGDFPVLLELLRAERFVGPRARTLLELAIVSASAGQPLVPEARANELVAAWVETFDTAGPEELAQVLIAAGPGFVVQRASDERPYVRAVAATALVRAPGPDELVALRKLIEDPEPRVQAAALLSLGEARVTLAQPEVLARARVGAGDVRAAALRSIGRLGGDGALAALLNGLAEKDPALRAAAAEGLSVLREPGTVPLLVSLLAKGTEDVTYAPARRGLVAQGGAAWDELLRMVRSPSSAARREAALVLSEQLVPQVVSALLTMLSEDAGDTRVAEELAIVTAVDFRGEPNPSAAWWGWWEFVVHDDAQAWLIGAAARLNMPVPTLEDLRSGAGPGLDLLVLLARREEGWLNERARREFARLIGRDPGPLPPRGREREAWLATLREQLVARRKG